MSIIVVDQGAELFWFVSNALLQDEIPMKHLKTITLSEEIILKELPEIVVLNGDDKSINPTAFISKMRNHVFARQTMFIIVTSDMSPEYRKSLIIAGASQVLYRGHHQNPSPKFFRSMVKWFLNYKTPDPQLLDFKPVNYPEQADLATFGRMGWITTTKCMLEVNVNLEPGQSIDFHSQLFEELGIKNAKITVAEKNKVGRYYQYANSLECTFVFSDPQKDLRKLEAWIANNQDVSKPKMVKLLYFEPEAEQREKIKQTIKAEKRYCARGFSNIEHFVEDVEFHLPQLILVNRKLIQQAKHKFEPLAKFLKGHFCYCITYDPENLTMVDTYKKQYEFALHSQTDIDSKLIDSMVAKLEAKMQPEADKPAQPKVYFNKYSAYSKISLTSTCAIKQFALAGIMLELPFQLSPYCAFELSSPAFSFINLYRIQYFRNFIAKKTSRGTFMHQAIFLGQTLADNEIIKNVLHEITEMGYDKWKSSKV